MPVVIYLCCDTDGIWSDVSGKVDRFFSLKQIHVGKVWGRI